MTTGVPSVNPVADAVKRILAMTLEVSLSMRLGHTRIIPRLGGCGSDLRADPAGCCVGVGLNDASLERTSHSSPFDR